MIRGREKRTVEEGIKVIVVYLALFDKILAFFRTCFDLEVDDYVTKGCFQEKGHCTS
jgi:hypothetical protein